MDAERLTAKEGDLYETLSVDGKYFEIRYGYYEDFERDSSEPTPIYPDLVRVPMFGNSGKRIVAHMQEPCPHFSPLCDEVERCCGCCKHYNPNKQMIDLCLCTEK